MLNYYAIFTPSDGGWVVRFPDVPSALTEGETIEQALENAVDALSAILAVGRKGREYFAPRLFAEIDKEKEEGDLVMPVPPSEAIMDEYRPKKRINVMADVELLARIDQQAAAEKTDRSSWLMRAARKVIEGSPCHETG